MERSSTKRSLNDERGASLIGVVVSLALIVILGGTLFYGYGALAPKKQGETTYQSTKSSVNSSLISSTLKMDMSGATATKIDGAGSGLQIARSDGSCVRWTIVNGEKDTGSVLRSSSYNAPAARGGSEVAKGISAGQFTGSSSVSIDLSYGAGQSYHETVASAAASGDRGECW